MMRTLQTRLLAVGGIALLAGALWLSVAGSAATDSIDAEPTDTNEATATKEATEVKPTETQPKATEVKPTETQPKATETHAPKETPTGTPQAETETPHPTSTPQVETETPYPTSTPQVETETPNPTSTPQVGTETPYPTSTPQVGTETPIHATRTPAPVFPNAGGGPSGTTMPAWFLALAGMGMLMVIVAGGSLAKVRQMQPAEAAQYLPAKPAERLIAGEQVGTGWLVLAGTIAAATTIAAVMLSKRRD